jgi:hypothetical protein
MGKLQFSIKKRFKSFTSVIFFSIFGHPNPGFVTGSGSGNTVRKNDRLGFALNPCGSITCFLDRDSEGSESICSPKSVSSSNELDRNE